MAHETGTFSYNPAGGEQIIKEMTITQRTEIGAIFLDLNLVTVAAIIRVYNKINGTDYVQIGNAVSSVQEAINLVNAGLNGESVRTFTGGKLDVDTDLKITIEPQPV